MTAFPKDKTEGDELSMRTRLRNEISRKPLTALTVSFLALAFLGTIAAVWVNTILRFSEQAGWATFTTIVCLATAAGLTAITASEKSL